MQDPHPDGRPGPRRGNHLACEIFTTPPRGEYGVPSL